MPIIEHLGIEMLKRGGVALLQDYQKRRADEAREILLNAMRAGQVYRITEDQAAAALFAFMRAAEEGTARRNLEMIAEAFANAAQEPTFAPDEFRRHTRMLADLSRDEIVVVAQLIKANRSASGTLPEVRTYFQQELETALVGPGKFFVSDRELLQHLSALQRTGLVVSESVLGGDAYLPTGLLVRIERLIDFDRVRDQAEQELRSEQDNAPP